MLTSSHFNQNNMQKVILVIFISSLFMSCRKSQRPEAAIFIDLDSGRESKLSEFFEELEYLQLDVPDSIPLVKVWKFDMSTDKIFVSDRELNNVLIFDAFGQFKNIIKATGQGPNEFQSMEDYQIFDDHIYVLDGSLRKILKFDFEGKVKDEIRIEFHPYNFFINESGILYYFGNRPSFEYQSVVSVKNGSIDGLKEIQKDLEGLNYSSVYGFQYDNYDRNVLLKLDTSYEVLIFDEQLNKERELKFDFGRYNFPDEKRKEFFMGYERYAYLMENQMIEMIFSFIPLKSHYLMIVNQTGKPAKTIFIDKKLDDIEVIDKMINDMDGFQANFSPVFQKNGNLIQVKGSRNFYNEYLENFSGKSIDTALIRDPKSIHHFFNKHKEKLKGDHYVIIKNRIKE